jgi:hypothetical protein
MKNAVVIKQKDDNLRNITFESLVQRDICVCGILMPTLPQNSTNI